MNDLLTPTLLQLQNSLKGEWLAHSHTAAYTREPRRWMTYSLTLFCLYKRAKRVNELPTSTLLPLKKNQEDEWLTHSHTVAYTKEQRGWMTYSLSHCCLYKRVKRVNNLLTPTLLYIQKRQEVEWLTQSHNVAYTKEGELLTHSNTVADAKEPRG